MQAAGSLAKDHQTEHVCTATVGTAPCVRHSSQIGVDQVQMQAMRFHLRERILLQNLVWIAPCIGQISIAPLKHLMPWSHLESSYMLRFRNLP